MEFDQTMPEPKEIREVLSIIERGIDDDVSRAESAIGLMAGGRSDVRPW